MKKLITCIICKKQKSIKDFYKCELKNYSYRCNECCRKRHSEWGKRRRKYNKQANLEHNYRNSELCKKFGYDAKIIAAYYLSQYSLQNGCCAICGKHQEFLGIDHNHNTGKLRKLLCVSCNLAVGNIKESVENCYKMAKYLQDNN